MHWLDNLSLKWKLLGGFGVVLLIVAVQGVITLRSTASNERTQEQYADSYEAIVQSEQVYGAVLTMQSAQRGFLLTGKDSYLEPYSTGWEQFKNAIASARSHGTHDAAQVARYDDIETRVEAWRTDVMDVYIQTRRDVDAGKKTFAELDAMLATGRAKAEADAIKAVLMEAEARERELLGERDQAMIDSSTMLSRLVMAGSGLSVVIGVAVALFLTVSITRRASVVRGRLSSIENNCLEALETGIGAVEQGDLTVSAKPVTPKIDKPGKDELARWRRA
ncbi:MAG: CHASE3 domain-containing protein [Thermoflexaceae bacterium]|nr:CHASE3 domain-containing protein [Thermoflexaceae bacterium]